MYLIPKGEILKNFVRTIQYLRGTHNMGVMLGVQDPPCVYAYVDASYAVHPDMKSHTGCVISLGMGPIYAKSSTQKLNTKSSTEAELVGLSDCSNQVIWTRNFLIQQGYIMPPAVMYQDNMSTTQLIKNGRSTSEKTRHVDIRFFFMHDRVNSGDVSLVYMNTKDMTADALTKGEPFRVLRDKLLNWYV